MLVGKMMTNPDTLCVFIRSANCRFDRLHIHALFLQNWRLSSLISAKYAGFLHHNPCNQNSYNYDDTNYMVVAQSDQYILSYSDDIYYIYLSCVFRMVVICFSSV